MIRRLAGFISNLPRKVPNALKPFLKPLAPLYVFFSGLVYGAQRRPVLLRTPTGPVMYIDYSDNVERAIAAGIYEEQFALGYHGSLKDGDTVIDVGAYSGYFTLLASERIGQKGEVFSFEPVQGNYRRLEKNLKASGVTNARVFNMGLLDGRKELMMNVPSGLPEESTICDAGWTEERCGRHFEKKAVKAYFVKFDDLVEKEDIPAPDLIKVDVEGSETGVLLGMRRTLREGKAILFMEIVPRLMRKAGYEIDEFYGIISECGYRQILSADQCSAMNLDRCDLEGFERFLCSGGINYVIVKEPLPETELSGKKRFSDVQIRP